MLPCRWSAIPSRNFPKWLCGLEIGFCLHAGESLSETNRGREGHPRDVRAAGRRKTSTVVNLARRLAMSGHKVVIVDADLRRPQVSAALGLRVSKCSLTDHLARRCTLDEALRPDPRSPLVALDELRT